MTPTNLALLDNGDLEITWNDGSKHVYDVRVLRDACPCATCREKRQATPELLPVLKPEEAQPLQINGMRPVGNYAYCVEFSDGHDTGIYTFEFLLRLAQG